MPNTAQIPSLPVSLTFEGVELTIIGRRGKPWLTAGDLARALGYSRADSVSRIYDRNAEEFTEEMTETVKLTVSGNLQTETRIFSSRGCHLVAMFSKTAKAKEFRKWVLDVLDGITLHHPPKIETITPEQYRKLSNTIYIMAHNMHYTHSVQWNAWQRLRDTFGCGAKDIPAERFEDALAIVQHMANQADSFKDKIREVNHRFCKEVLRMGGDLDDLERKLESLH